MLQKFLADGSHLQPAHRLAMLAGHPRSGTTLLEQILDAHRDVVSLEETRILRDNTIPLFLRTQKEQGGCDWLAKIPPAQLPPVRANYFAQAEKFLGQPIGNRLLIDKNPSLTAYFDQITKVFPEIKFMVALRDPRDVCLSCFMQPIPPTQVSAAYVDLGHTTEEYANVMGLWLEFRDKMAAPWLEVRYEDTVNNLEATARRTLEFLDLSWDERVLGFNEHAKQKLVRSPTYADVGKPIYKSSLGRWQNYRKYLEPHLAVLEPFLRAFGYA
jgi:Sulfotransferase family